VVAAVVEHLPDARDSLALFAVHLELDDDAVVAREGAALGERLADLLERLLLGHRLRNAVGAGP
jgi:hypothetical protein